MTQRRGIVKNNGSSGSGASRSDNGSGSDNNGDVATADVVFAGTTKDASVQDLAMNMLGLMVDVDKACQFLPESPPMIDWCIDRNA